jgi:drug/metabolite transporter (DMT)-like permease
MHLLVQMVAMGDVSATETAIVYGLEPVWGAAFAWFLLGERWDNAAWVGAALVLCKCCLFCFALYICTITFRHAIP